MKKILFLYSEVMPYTLSVFKSLVNDFNCDVNVVNWDEKKRTPYVPTNKQIKFYKRSKLNIKSIKNLVQEIAPDLIFVSGRMDKAYLSIAKHAKKNGLPVVMGIDKQWKGNWRDWLAVLLKRFLYQPYFTHAWVCGYYQFEYVRRVGFGRKQIIKNFYSADIDNFMGADVIQTNYKDKSKDILYVGRLHSVKGISGLIQVLDELKQEGIFSGNLWLYGSGPLENDIPNTEWIKKMGFASQEQLLEGCRHCSFFCLPSKHEPWGVVIHEMAAAGMPLICSDACGAATEFLIDGYNGWTFQKDSLIDLRNKITRLLTLDLETVNKFGNRSRQLSQRITPEQSAGSLLSVIE